MITDFAFIDIASPEMLLLLVVAALIFGGKKVANTSKTIGSSLRSMKDEVDTLSHNITETRQTIAHQATEIKNDIKTVTGPSTEKASPKKEDA